MAGGRWNPRTTRAVVCLALFAAPGCGSQSKAVSRGTSDANAPAIVQGDGDANAPVQVDASWDQPRTSCPWATSAVTESPSALYLASTGYTGAPPVYEPKGSISAVTSLGACLEAPADAGATGAYEAVFSYVLGGSSEVFVPIGTENSFSPAPAARGQVELFGRQGDFAVAFDGSPITWHVGALSVTATASSPPCAPGVFAPGSYPCGMDSCPAPAPAVCGDGTCTAPEDCRTCPGDCDCSGLTPLFDCVQPGTDGGLEAWFGYQAQSNVNVAYGPSNFFSPGTYARGQPERFVAGEYHRVLPVVLRGASLTWTLGGKMAQATTAGPACPTCTISTCTSGPGLSCAGDSCAIPCGDGWCDGWDGEGPWTCPDDCSCPTCQVNLRNSCANPATCGIDWECGSGISFGVFVDCGECPAGKACVPQRHLCQ